MLISNGMVETPRLVCPQKQEFQKDHGCVAGNVEPVEQCPILDDYVWRKPELSLPVEKHGLSSSEFPLSSNLAYHLLRGKVVLIQGL